MTRKIIMTGVSRGSWDWAGQSQFRKTPDTPSVAIMERLKRSNAEHESCLSQALSRLFDQKSIFRKLVFEKDQARQYCLVVNAPLARVHQ